MDRSRKENVDLSRLGELTNLVVLSLQDNELTHLPLELGNLENLQRLYLQKNKLTELPSSLGRLKKLTDLNASCNQLSVFPDVVFQMPALALLNLSRNVNMLELPDALYRCRSMVLLDITGIPFPKEPLLVKRLHWIIVSIDKLVPTGKGSFYGNNAVTYEPSYFEEKDFYDFMSSRATKKKTSVVNRSDTTGSISKRKGSPAKTSVAKNNRSVHS